MAEIKGTPEGTTEARVEELAAELYGRFARDLPYLSDNERARADLLTLAHQLAEEQAAKEEELKAAKELAVLDPLIPDFFNHKHLMHLLDLETQIAARAPTPNSAFIVFDIDDFKIFNDTYGHPEGDRLLKSVGKAINEAIRRSDTPGRLGGDELGAIIRRTTNIDGAVAAARRVQTAVQKTIQEEFGAQVKNPTLSIGLCLITPGFSAKEIYGMADTAVYDSKNTGKNRISIAMFNPTTKSVQIKPVKSTPLLNN